jgi:hypothetical protein
MCVLIELSEPVSYRWVARVLNGDDADFDIAPPLLTPALGIATSATRLGSVVRQRLGQPNKERYSYS